VQETLNQFRDYIPKFVINLLMACPPEAAAIRKVYRRLHPADRSVWQAGAGFSLVYCCPMGADLLPNGASPLVRRSL
jgi:hypothetical protein